MHRRRNCNRRRLQQVGIRNAAPIITRARGGGGERTVSTIRGDEFDVSTCQTIEEAKVVAAEYLGLPREELLFLRGREVLTDDNFLARDVGDNSNDDYVDDDLRVLHRPPPPSYLILRYFCLAAYALLVGWYAYVDVGPAGLLSTAIMVILFRFAPRAIWERLVPPPSRSSRSLRHRRRLIQISEHLVVVPLYGENAEYLEPMLTSLIRARRTWPLTVLFAAEGQTDERWLRGAELRLMRLADVSVVAVRHPPGLLNEVSGAASNLNWALETFCLESSNHPPGMYLLTKCDSNGVLDGGYLEEIEGIATRLVDRPFFIQPRPGWHFSAKWNWFDRVVLDRLGRVLVVGEGGVTHFSFPLDQFVEAGRYSHSSTMVLDDVDCYQQQESMGAQYVESASRIWKFVPSRSDLGRRLCLKWIPQAFGTSAVEMSFRRTVVYPFRLCACMLYFEVVAVCLKILLLARNNYF